MNPAVAEYSVQLNYLQLMLDLPWESYTKDNLDLNHAKKRLDNDHFGLDEVKDRILEHLAVIKLKGDLKSPILCLYGPPGVGKTTLARLVATALDRKMFTLSAINAGVKDVREVIEQARKNRFFNTPAPFLFIDEIHRFNKSQQDSLLGAVEQLSLIHI